MVAVEGVRGALEGRDLAEREGKERKKKEICKAGQDAVGQTPRTLHGCRSAMPTQSRSPLLESVKTRTEMNWLPQSCQEQNK
jgi:hypothetical protein